MKRITNWTYEYTQEFQDAINGCDENKVFELFNNQNWKIHLKGLKFKESRENVLRVVSYPLLDLIQKYPKVAEYVFSKMMKILINKGEREAHEAQLLFGKLHAFYIHIQNALPDTGEDSNLVHRRKRPKVDTLFSSLFSTRPSDDYDSLPRRKNSRLLLDVFACIGNESIFWFVLSKKCLSENYDELVIFYNRRKYPHQKKKSKI